MPSINMIAARRAEKLKLEKQVRGVIMAVFVEIAIALGILSVMTARIFGGGLVVDRLNNDMKKIEPTVKTIAVYESRIRDLKPKLDLLADSRESTMLWTSILHDLSSSMPSDTWLNNLQTTVAMDSSQPDPTKRRPKTVLTLIGTSGSQRLVGEAMLRLSQRPEFEKVDLNFTTQNASHDLEGIDFSLAAKLKSKEAPQREELKDVKN